MPGQEDFCLTPARPPSRRQARARAAAAPGRSIAKSRPILDNGSRCQRSAGQLGRGAIGFGLAEQAGAHETPATGAAGGAQPPGHSKSAEKAGEVLGHVGARPAARGGTGDRRRSGRVSRRLDGRRCLDDPRRMCFGHRARRAGGLARTGRGDGGVRAAGRRRASLARGGAEPPTWATWRGACCASIASGRPTRFSWLQPRSLPSAGRQRSPA